MKIISDRESEQMIYDLEIKLMEQKTPLYLEDIDACTSNWIQVIDTIDQNTNNNKKIVLMDDSKIKLQNQENKPNLVWIVYVNYEIDKSEKGLCEFSKMIENEVEQTIKNKLERKALKEDEICQREKGGETIDDVIEVGDPRYTEKGKLQIHVYSKYLSNLKILNKAERKRIEENLHSKIGKFYTPNHKNALELFISQLKFTGGIEELKVGILSRSQRAVTESLEYKHSISSGNVYTANLYDLVQVYNRMGNKLFQHNLRYGIADKLNVNENIINTLKNHHKEFWYLNNGITLLVDKSLVDLKSPNEIVFRNITENNLFSIINGAQTLNASAEHFFTFDRENPMLVLNEKTGEEIDKDKEKQELIKKFEEIEKENQLNTWVVFKVVIIEDTSGKNTDISKKQLKVLKKRWINKISISLNRQKPIKSEDIGTTQFLIDELNSIEDPKYGFEIIKNGERSSFNEKKYQISEFSKVLVACYTKTPWESKNSTQKLLEVEQTANSFNENIQTGKDLESGVPNEESILEIESLKNKAFRGQEYLLKVSNEEGNSEEDFGQRIFNEYYKPVNYLMRAYAEFMSYNKLLKSKNEKYETILGKNIKIINDYLIEKNKLEVKEEAQTKTKEEGSTELPPAKMTEETFKKVIDYSNFHVLVCYVWSNNKFEEDKFIDWTKTDRDALNELKAEETKNKAILDFIISWIEFNDVKNQKQLDKCLSIDAFKKMKPKKTFDDLYEFYQRRI